MPWTSLLSVVQWLARVVVRVRAVHHGLFYCYTTGMPGRHCVEYASQLDLGQKYGPVSVYLSGVSHSSYSDDHTLLGFRAIGLRIDHLLVLLVFELYVFDYVLAPALGVLASMPYLLYVLFRDWPPAMPGLQHEKTARLLHIVDASSGSELLYLGDTIVANLRSVAHGIFLGIWHRESWLFRDWPPAMPARVSMLLQDLRHIVPAPVHLSFLCSFVSMLCRWRGLVQDALHAIGAYLQCIYLCFLHGTWLGQFAVSRDLYTACAASSPRDCDGIPGFSMGEHQELPRWRPSDPALGV